MVYVKIISGGDGGDDKDFELLYKDHILGWG